MPPRKNNLSPKRIQKSERLRTAMQLRSAGADFAQIAASMNIKHATAKQYVTEGLKALNAENTELAELVREEEMNKLADLYRLERVKAEEFKHDDPQASSAAAKLCILIVRRMTQLRDAEPAIKIDIHEIQKAARNRFEILSHVMAQYIDEETLGLIKARWVALESDDNLAAITREIIEAEAELLDTGDDDDGGDPDNNSDNDTADFGDDDG